MTLPAAEPETCTVRPPVAATSSAASALPGATKGKAPTALKAEANAGLPPQLSLPSTRLGPSNTASAGSAMASVTPKAPRLGPTARTSRFLVSPWVVKPTVSTC